MHVTWAMLGWLLDTQFGEQLLEKVGGNHELAAVSEHVFDFIEAPEQAHLGGGILFGIGDRTTVTGGPGLRCSLRQKHAHRVCELPVRADIEDEFGGGYV